MPLASLAQVTVKQDGQWRHLFGAGASFSSGNSDASSLNLSLDSVRATEMDKWSVTGRALHSRSDDETTAERFGLDTQYDRDLSLRWFGFGKAGYLRDEPSNLESRFSTGGGVGYHFYRRDENFWDLTTGLGYTRDSYVEPTEIDGAQVSRYGRFEMLLGEESNHKFTDTASLKQKLSLYPNLRDSGEYRAEFDTALSVAINSTLSLTAGVTYRYTTQPGDGLERGDTLFVTGVSVRLD